MMKNLKQKFATAALMLLLLGGLVAPNLPADACGVQNSHEVVTVVVVDDQKFAVTEDGARYRMLEDSSAASGLSTKFVVVDDLEDFQEGGEYTLSHHKVSPPVRQFADI